MSFNYYSMNGLRAAAFTGVFALGALIGGAAAANNSGSNDGTAANSDADRMICKRIGETGSRLRSNKVCMTKAQWDDKRRLDRQEIEKGQMQGCMPTAECS